MTVLPNFLTSRQYSRVTDCPNPTNLDLRDVQGYEAREASHTVHVGPLVISRALPAPLGPRKSNTSSCRILAVARILHLESIKVLRRRGDLKRRLAVWGAELSRLDLMESDYKSEWQHVIPPACNPWVNRRDSTRRVTECLGTRAPTRPVLGLFNLYSRGVLT